LTPEGEIVDGYHRLAKARLLGVREIAALRLPDNYREHAAGKV
jgi:ParB-like chromosome segregation protein Spo0J